MTKSDPNMITLKLTWQKLEWIKYYPKIAEIQDNLITAYRQGDKSKVHDLQRKGGKYTMDNIVPLHQICHQHYTHQV